MAHSDAVNDVEPGKREWISFWSLVGMQTANAFNDNFAKFILIPMGVALASMGIGFAGVEYALGLLLVLPFILFAPTAGWLGDRFAKNQVIRWSSWFQLVVLLLMVAALKLESLPLVLIAFFLLATQSALLSPAKMGISKELLGSSRLGFANGVIEGTVILAILLGQIIGGVWFDKWGLQAGKGPWEAAATPVMWVLVGALGSLVLSHLIQRTKPQSSEKFSRAVTLRHFQDLKVLWDDAPMWRCSLGIAFFWGFGGFLQLLLVQIATETTGGTKGMGVETALLWLPVVLGIVLGSLLASWICHRRNELGLVVIGGGLMTLSMLLLAFAPREGLMVKGFLGIAGFGGALFLVPLNAYLQDRAPENERGMVIAASNLCINLAGVAAVGLQFALKAIGVPPWAQYLCVAVACGAATIHIMRLLPKDFVRLLVLGLVRSIYRIRVQGVANIPEKGGVLLVANHMSYVDGLILSAACPRSIRFLMFADCFDRKWIGKGARFFDTVPISPSRAKEAISVASKALEEGAVVCIFPEGQLSRTGGLSVLQRGYQLIARRSKAPVLPAYMDGLWGSIFSFSGGNFMKKWPKTLRYGVSVAFGEKMAPKGNLQGELQRLSCLTAVERETAFRKSEATEPKLLSDLPLEWSALKEMAWADDVRGRQLRTNALQLGQVNIASRDSRILVECDGASEESAIVGLLWPIAIHAPVALIDRGRSDERILLMVKQKALNAVVLYRANGRQSLIDSLVKLGVDVWALEEGRSSVSGIHPLWVCDGRVVAYTLPDPDYVTTTQLPQPGSKEGSRGKLLPGFHLKEGDIYGPALGKAVSGEVFSLDEESFLT